MTDEVEESAAAPPFDVVPDPEETESDSRVGTTTSANLAWLRWALVALFVAAIGFGQGIGLTYFFGKGDDHLRADVDEKEENRSPGSSAREEKSIPAGGAALAPAARHELDIARDRFGMGDIEGARRIAASFLLRLDGMGREESLRASEAYALLADVLRHEYERSLLDVEDR